MKLSPIGPPLRAMRGSRPSAPGRKAWRRGRRRRWRSRCLMESSILGGSAPGRRRRRPAVLGPGSTSPPAAAGEDRFESGADRRRARGPIGPATRAGSKGVDAALPARTPHRTASGPIHRFREADTIGEQPGAAHPPGPARGAARDSDVPGRPGSGPARPRLPRLAVSRPHPRGRVHRGVRILASVTAARDPARPHRAARLAGGRGRRIAPGRSIQGLRH
jgi:hypothetical protein